VLYPSLNLHIELRPDLALIHSISTYVSASARRDAFYQAGQSDKHS